MDLIQTASFRRDTTSTVAAVRENINSCFKFYIINKFSASLNWPFKSGYYYLAFNISAGACCLGDPGAGVCP
jgi:hypothetical protein